MPLDPLQFRQTLGRWASGVTVVSCDHGPERRGMTASAFISVSLTPPLILVSVDHRAGMHATLQQAERFGVSILAREQEWLSNHFAGRPGDAEVPWELLGGVPVLGGALAALACRKANAVEAGDHTLFIGEVEGSVLGEGEPLLYFAGRYGDFA